MAKIPASVLVSAKIRVDNTVLWIDLVVIQKWLILKNKSDLPCFHLQ